MSFTNLKSAYVTTTASVISSRCRLRGFHIMQKGTAAGSVAFEDGTTVVLRIGITSTQTAPSTLTLTPGGMIFESNMRVSVPASVECTVFYD